MEKKTVYKTPLTEIVQVRLNSPIQQDPGIDGSHFNYDEQLGRENRGSFFDEDESDDGLLNGGPNMFTDWEDKDRL